ncbi:hypothetical protein DFJ73DRAFT_839014 [Zopfochytrium polystomum]|nr:hypothetical protein DFJ73DRAFT_839014 [Zopfochytrium polystomum]
MTQPHFFTASAMTACRDDADNRLRQTLAAHAHDHNVHNSPHHHHDPSSPYHSHQHNHHDHNYKTPSPIHSYCKLLALQPSCTSTSPHPRFATLPILLSGPPAAAQSITNATKSSITTANRFRTTTTTPSYRQDPYPTPTIPSLSPLGTMTPPLPPTLLPSATLNTAPVVAALQADRAQPTTSTTTTRRSRAVQRWTHYSARKDGKGQEFSFCIHRRQQRYCRTCCAPTGELPSTAAAAVLSQVGQGGGVAAAAATLTWVVMQPGAGGGGSTVATPAASPFLAADVGDERKKKAAANPFSVDALLTDRLPSRATSFDGSPTPEMERAALSPH